MKTERKLSRTCAKDKLIEMDIVLCLHPACCCKHSK